MISALHQRKLLPTLVMLFALAGLSLSVIGESFSHGVANLTATQAVMVRMDTPTILTKSQRHPQCIMMLAIILTRPWTSSGFRLFPKA